MSNNAVHEAVLICFERDIVKYVNGIKLVTSVYRDYRARTRRRRNALSSKAEQDSEEHEMAEQRIEHRNKMKG